MSVLVVYVCHDNNSLNKIINNKNSYIIFVGKNEIDEDYKNNDKIIVARDLPFNIEHESKLLTFTAWYAIIKNNLFLEYEYLCILEYDTLLSNNFENNLNSLCAVNKYDVISFIEACKISLYLDINLTILDNFLNLKKIKNEVTNWACTTNHCIRRNILDNFVNWYYPDCFFIKKLDENKFSFYHERLFMIWLKNKNIDYFTMKGLEHGFLNSHQNW